MSWKAIETAPDEAVLMLLWDGVKVRVGYRDGGSWHKMESQGYFQQNVGGDEIVPLMWAPMPKGPAKS